MTPRDLSLHPSRRERMLALLDLLSPEDEARLNAHLADCTICHEWMAEARAELERHEYSEHIPASILARWRRVELTMGSRERALYERHLRSCGTCAEALSLVLGSHSSTSPAEQYVVARGLVGKRAWISWAAFGWGLAFAAVAILVLVFAPRLTRHPQEQLPIIAQPESASSGAPEMPAPGPSSAPPQKTAKAPMPETGPSEGAAVTIALAPVGETASFELHAQQRGVQEKPLEVVAGARRRALRLRVPPTPLFDPSQPIDVRIIGPDDRVLATLRTTPRDLASRPIVQANPRDPWAPGEYRVELVTLAPPEPGFEPETVAYPFRIR